MQSGIIKFLTLLLLTLFSVQVDARHFLWHRFTPKVDETNLWSVMRQHFTLPDASDNPKVKAQIEWIQSHPLYLNNMTQQADPYLYYVFHEVRRQGMPGELALLPMIESSYNPFAYSQAGAAGLWQLMPSTALGLGLKQNWWYDGRRDVHQSTSAALRYLRYLHEHFAQNWLLALAAYDSGEGTVRSAMSRHTDQRHATDYWALPLPDETKAYLPRLLALVAIIRNPEHYRVELPKIANEPRFVRVDVGQQVNLARVAELAGISEQLIYSLNPGFNRWATDPNGPHKIVLPVSALDAFQSAQPATKKSRPTVIWQSHTVQQGDTLALLAKRYDTQSAIIRAVNDMQGDALERDHMLLIPEHAHSLKNMRPGQRNDAAMVRLAKMGPQQYIHHVQTTDKLETIAQHYHVTTAAIRHWNQLMTDNLKENQGLVIWSHVKKEQLEQFRHHNYRVHCGESLHKIAKRYHTSVAELQRRNPQLQQHGLYCKQKLLIPLAAHSRGKYV